MASVTESQLFNAQHTAASHKNRELNSKQVNENTSVAMELPLTMPQTHRFNPDFTQSVIDATGPKASPRIRKVMASMIRHIHDFARENEITMDEWMAGVEMPVVQLPSRLQINRAGRMSDDRRNERQLLCDVIGLESLVDGITYKLATDVKDVPTSTAILGPFWRANAPHREMGSTIVHNVPNGDHTLMYGIVTDYLTGEPVEGAVLDVWHTAPHDGKYSFYCLRPTSYPIPHDGPAGQVLELLDRHPMRPAHIHFIISAPNYKPIITQIFDRRGKHITDDAVFAVKDSLVVDFLPRKGDPKADFELPYDFKLATFEEAQKNDNSGTTEESASYGADFKHG